MKAQLLRMKEYLKNLILHAINVCVLRPLWKFPLDKRKVVYIPVDFNFCGNARFLLDEWLELGGYRHVYLCDSFPPSCRHLDYHGVLFCRFNLRFLYHYATAGYVIRESEFNSVGLMPRKESKVVQLWHAAGAFKKFCLDIADRPPSLVRSRVNDIATWDMLLCSSESITGLYMQAFGGFDKGKIFVGGLPRNDHLYRVALQREDIREKYKVPSEKRVVLYAPTFRDRCKDYNWLVDFSIVFRKNLGDEYIVAVRVHPKIANMVSFPANVLDLNRCDVEEAMVLSDILITDYSSIVFDYALLGRLMLFYVPDLCDYYDKRGFYFDYGELVPGPIAETAEQVLELVSTSRFEDYSALITSFQKRFNPYFDGRNSKRLLKKILTLQD